MKKSIKKIGKILGYILLVVIIFISIILIVIRINSTGKPEPIVDSNGNLLPNSIAIIKDTVINGASQRLTIRGHDVSNPVLLRVHGGPGLPHAPQAYRFSGIDLEDKFTVCYWDQRGAGPAFKDEIPDSTITIKQVVEDGISVTEYLRKLLNKDKLYIEGMSFGTVIGSYMVAKKPEYYKSFIGVSQSVHMQRNELMTYDFILKEARRKNDTIAIRELEDIGRPPYKTYEEINRAVTTQRGYVRKYYPDKIKMNTSDIYKLMFLYDGWSMSYKWNIFNNGMWGKAAPLLWMDGQDHNLFEQVPSWEIPVYIIQGEHDHFTEVSIAKQYFDSIQAPYKRFYLIEGATHQAFGENPKKFREIMVNEVLEKD